MARLFRTNPLAVLLTGSVGCGMTVLDTNIVAIVLPTIARDLNASFADVEWVISTYVLCFASLLLPAGAIADRFGRRFVFLGGIAVFTIASLLCGAASQIGLLCAARALQGVGAAFLLAPALAVIGHAFHEESERARAWAIWGGMMGLAMVLSPILGGTIAFLLGWRWAFFVNLPICAALAVAVLLLVPESRDADARRLDPWGILLFAGTMFGLTWGLIHGQAQGWGTNQALAGFIGGTMALIGFVIAETRQARPMLDLSLFRMRRFVGAVLAMFGYAASAQVMASLLPLFLQNGLGHAPLAAGIAMLPFALAMLILPQIGRVLTRVLASHQILTLGLATVCLGNLITALAARTAQPGWVMLGMAVLGSGGGLLNGETTKGIMGVVPRDRAGMASGISTTSRFTGILLGFAVLSAVLGVSARTALVHGLCAAIPAQCVAAPGFAAAVVAGDLPKALASFTPDQTAIAARVARLGFAYGFSAALLTAAAIAGCGAMLVAILMRSAATPPRPQP